MSKHRYEKCCYPVMSGCGTQGYGMAGYGYGAAGYGTGYGFGGGGVRWIYALLILIVIVLQFGRNFNKEECVSTDTALAACGDDGLLGTAACRKKDNQLIDNSVLFIIIVFLLILCAGCFNNQGGYGY